MRRAGWVAGALILAGIFLYAGTLPTETRQGVNYRVSARRLPLLIKGLDFILRDHHLRQAAAEAARGLKDEEQRALALFQWTRQRIRPTPAGWPVVDDHISHILIRGHGEPDQMADVFTALSTYAGLPAFWKSSRSRSRGCAVILSFVRIGGEWTLWDVAHGLVYRSRQGGLAGVEEVAQEGDLEGLSPLEIPETLRARKQMPGPRIRFEIRKAWRRLLGQGR